VALERESNGEKFVNVDVDAFLVGDAAGRESDHSDSDRHFCDNLGVSFFTPEEFFLEDKTQVLGHKFDPSWHLPTSLGGTSILKAGKEV
jgi:bifunctional polynucleotide phosphatase/kinase